MAMAIAEFFIKQYYKIVFVYVIRISF